ncbi:MAG: hypothetical protein MN733_12525 [Nitrososphaera sp.]|nr:hypothetical protein [Nitrososphaera sp.]
MTEELRRAQGIDAPLTADGNLFLPEGRVATAVAAIADLEKQIQSHQRASRVILFGLLTFLLALFGSGTFVYMYESRLASNILSEARQIFDKMQAEIKGQGVERDEPNRAITHAATRIENIALKTENIGLKDKTVLVAVCVNVT